MKISRPILATLGFGLLGSGALASTVVASSLGGFSATVSNPSSSSGSGTLLLQEGVGARSCISTGTGTSASSSISSNANTNCPLNLFSSNNLEPGAAATSATVTLNNPGSLTASSLSLTPGSCTAGDNSSPGGISNSYFGTDTAGFCGKIDVSIENDSGSTPSCVFPVASPGVACVAPSSAGTLANLTSLTLPGLAAGASASYKISVALDSAATNADQGLAATMPLTWTLNQ